MDQSQFNPFEKIAKFNHKNYKSIAFFSFITVILLIPLALSAFANTSSATTSFLSGNLESIEVNDLLKEQFPDRSESNMIIILEKENGDSILLNDSLSVMLAISEALQNNEEIGDKVEISSIASIETGAQQAYDEGLNEAKDLITESLIEPLNIIAENISYLKSIYSNISDLAITIEQMGAFVDAYAILFYDLARSTYYLSNITSAFDSYFYFSDYSLLDPYWFNNSGTMPLNKLLVLQSYVGAFQNITQIRASPIFTDSFFNGFTFNFLNLSISSFSQLSDAEYVASPLYHLLLSLKQSWDNAFNNFTMTNPFGLSGSLTAIDPFTAQISQGLVLSNLNDIAQTAFPEFLAGLTKMFSQGGFDEESLDFGSLNPQAMLSVSVNNTLIQGLHDFPLGYMTTWADVSRSIFYLDNLTIGYDDFSSYINLTEIGVVQSYWVNESAGLWPFDPTILIATYNYTSFPAFFPFNLTKYGRYIINQALNNPIDADNMINDLVFEFLNQSFLMSAFFGNTTAYFASQEYAGLLLFRSTWNNLFSLFFSFDPLLNDLVGIPPGSPLVEFSQLGLVNRLNSFLNLTFVNYVSSSFETLSSASMGSSTTPIIPGPLYGLSVMNQSQLELYTNALATSLFSEFEISGLNSSQISTILETNLVPVGVEYRFNSTIPESVLKTNVMFLFNSILLQAESNQSLTDLFGTGSSEFSSPLYEPYIDAITEAINISLVLNQVYDTTVATPTLTVSEISTNASDRVVTLLRTLITFPTLNNNLGQDSEAFTPILEGFVGHNNKTTLLFVTFPGISDEEELNGYVELVRTEISSVLSEPTIEGNYNVWVTGGIPIGFDTDTSLEADIETVDRVTVVLVLVLLTMVFLSVVAPAVPLAGIGMAIMSALGTVYVLSEIIDIGIPSIMISLLTVTMLGAGVDYCLFVMWRYKEERQRGVNKYSAVKESVIHAGESVASSGSTVMIGFGSLLLSSFSLLNQMGLGPMIGIGFSLLAALTIIPIGLYLFGDRLFWPRKFRKDYLKKLEESGYDQAEIRQNPTAPISTKPSKNNEKDPFLRKMAKFTVKHPLIIIGIFVIVSIPFIYQVSRIEVSYDSVDFLPRNVEAVEGLEHLQGKFSLGTIFPVQVVLHFEDPISDNASAPFYNQEKLDLIDAFTTDLLNEFGETSDGRVWVAKITTITRPYGTPINRSEPLDEIAIAQMKQFVGSTSNNTIIVNLEVGEEIVNILVSAQKM
ncbi:MAG: MMPL family transporter [Candidatus Hodarchaeales archaeon]|jgi:predicted RND superfamily exporter protein